MPCNVLGIKNENNETAEGILIFIHHLLKNS